MKVLAVHNYYQQPGGEDQLFEDEVQLLQSRGHQVHIETVHSRQINRGNLMRTAAETVWNRRSHRHFLSLIRQFKPDVMHCTNTFPLFSPSIFYAARKMDVPLVATVQNYRYFCAQGMCFRNTGACEACLGKIPWRAVRYGCYRGSRMGSAVVASMQWLHQRLQTWNERVDVICAASEFSRNKLIAAGIHGSQIFIKPNFVAVDPGFRQGSGNHAVFAGRLAEEKGIQTLVDAWHRLANHGKAIPLKIIGDGPCRDMVETLAAGNPNVICLGRLSNDQVMQLLGEAGCLIFPSTGYESLPKTLIESMAVGTPVIGSNVGSIPEIVIERQTGCLFAPGNAAALAESVTGFFGNPCDLTAMRDNCRQQYLTRFTADSNYHQLMKIYQAAIRRRSGTASIETAGADATMDNAGGR